jgi:hypothetical protein
MLLHYLFPFYLFLFAPPHRNPLPENECSDCISRNVSDYVEFSTPPDKEIVFSKIIRQDTVYRIQFMMSSADFKVMDSTAYVDLSNNTQVGRLRVAVNIKMTDSMKKPFILSAAFDLSKQEIITLSNFQIKSFTIGRQKCEVDHSRQKAYMQYFRCLRNAG